MRRHGNRRRQWGQRQRQWGQRPPPSYRLRRLEQFFVVGSWQVPREKKDRRRGAAEGSTIPHAAGAKKGAASRKKSGLRAARGGHWGPWAEWDGQEAKSGRDAMEKPP